MIRFQNILVALDTRDTSHPTFEWAMTIAKPCRSDLTIVDVVPDFSWIAKLVVPDADDIQQVMADDKLSALEAIAKPLREQGLDVATKVLRGKTSQALTEEVLRADHDLLVRITKGANSRSAGFFGTTGSRLLRKCPCAVALIEREYSPNSGRIAAAIDVAPIDAAQKKMQLEILKVARFMADKQHSKFHVVYVWEMFGAGLVKSRFSSEDLTDYRTRSEAEVARAVDALLKPYELSHRDKRVHLIENQIGAGREIAEFAEEQNMEMIVLGTVARSGIAGAVIGNTAERVLERATCSILAIKPDAYIAPASVSNASAESFGELPVV